MTTCNRPSAKAAIDALPDVLRTGVQRYLERYDEQSGGRPIPDACIAVLVRLLACSEFAASTFLRESAWCIEHHRQLAAQPDAAELEAFADGVAASEQPIEIVKQEIRRFRNRYYLRVLWREYAGTATLNETLESISELADRLLAAAAAYSARQVRERFGCVRDDNGQAVSLVILGMGKLGGRELNLSSDIDLVFLYPGGGDSDGPKSLSAQEYFTRVSQLIVALIGEATADGFAFRIDTRLRPFGDSGPPVASFAALESYLVQHGRGWERYAYIKARAVGPRPPAEVQSDLYDNLITPFVYRRYIDFGVFESLREMRALIAAEVKRRDLADNIKLGPGGIREIEFIVQSLQLVRGGSMPELQDRQLQRVLPKLTGRHGIDERDASLLQAAYVFLRRIENFIQAIRDQQTHDLPAGDVDRARLATAMGYSGWSDLLTDLDRHRQNVARQFARIAFREPADESGDDMRRAYAELWKNADTADDWAEALAGRGFDDSDAMAATITAFRQAAKHADTTAGKRLQQFIPKVLSLLQESDRPALALQRVLDIGEQVLRRSAYLALLNENAPAMRKLLDLCARSAYVAGQITRFPVLLDELLDPRIYTERITRASLDSELRQRITQSQAGDSETQMELLAAFQRAFQFRIALADFNGNLPIMRVSDALTDLAESVLGVALEFAWRDTTQLHGVPMVRSDGAGREAGFGIVAYGKLGGLELSYGSDLDLVFLHDSAGTGQMTNGKRPLDNTMFFTRLVRRLVHFLTTQTGSGMLYEIDMRLRPEGRSGLLVTSVDAFARYQEENAWTWEHQALLRARPVAGSDAIACEFDRIRARTLSAGLHRDSLKNDVKRMRSKMRQQLDKSDETVFDLKQGKGGIGDIEFLVQYLVLANAAEQPEVFRYTDNIRQLDALAATACIETQLAADLQETYRRLRLRAHHLRLDERPPLVQQTEFRRRRQQVIHAWQAFLDN